MDCAAVDAAFAAALLGDGADFADSRALQTGIDRFNAAAPPAPGLVRRIDRLRVDASSVQLTALRPDQALDAHAAQAAASWKWPGPPPPPCARHVPWPRELDGQPLTAAGKAPRKPLDLLALRVAQGEQPLTGA